MKKFAPWAAAAVIIFIIFGTLYGVVQQAQRQDANYPQIQIAEDAATALNGRAKPATLIQGKVDLNASLAPFIIIYNKTGQVVAGSGYLNGTIPKAPYGVLVSANNKAYHSVTWQPEGNARIAAVSVAANNYYVLSGRSLTEVEKNETNALQFTLLGGIGSLLVLVATFVLSTKRFST